jgi:isoleucyl-tRNA synthetase
MGSLCNASLAEFITFRKEHSYDEKFPQGESSTEVKRRFGEFLYDLETKHEGKNILIITHGIGLEMLVPIASGADATETRSFVDADLPKNAEVRELPFVPLPHNEDYELDFHRSYIDDVVLVSETGTELRRVKEVMDVWFDSGSMPLAQDHYPFQNQAWIDEKGYPADYISEAIDQTRGWFYTLLAVGALTGKGTPYKNVICLGHLLDEKGQKMSKSKGNVIEPMQAIEHYGADTLRYWMYSVNQPGDSKSFDDKTVKEAARVLSWFENSVKFYQLFSAGDVKTEEQVIDVWMRTRLSETIAQSTKAFDAYDLYTASRSIGKLIEDLSQWYVRRVRDRVRDGDTAALSTLKDTIQGISVLLAPLTPFIAEWAYQIVREEDDAESVHLADWYEPGTIDADLITDMERTRAIASEALMLRQKAGVKVSQPLRSLSIPGELRKDLGILLCEEVNVEELVMGTEQISLDTDLTADLVKKGDERLFARAVAAARKTAGFSQTDSVRVEENEKGEYFAEISTGEKRFNLILENAT